MLFWLKRFLLAALSVAIWPTAGTAADGRQSLELPDMTSRQAIRLAQEIGRRAGERVWHGMARAPFDVLFIERDRETLFCSPLRKGFGPRVWDPTTHCWMQTRARTQDPDSFGAADIFGDHRDVILVGSPPSDPEDFRFWLTLMVHEHFHQLQDAKPWMNAEAKELAAIFGGGTGDNNWSLVFPFPYQRPQVGEAFDKLAKDGLDFLQARGAEDRNRAAAEYVKQRSALEHLVTPTEWKYFEEQAWTEGIARWTQAPAIDAYAKITGDPVWIKEAQGMHRARIVSLNAVRRDGLKKWKRGAIYEVGAVEGEIAATRCKDWKSAYWAHHFTMKPLLVDKC